MTIAVTLFLYCGVSTKPLIPMGKDIRSHVFVRNVYTCKLLKELSEGVRHLVFHCSSWVQNRNLQH
jgi:hypothetical protein